MVNQVGFAPGSMHSDGTTSPGNSCKRARILGLHHSSRKANVVAEVSTEDVSDVEVGSTPTFTFAAGRLTNAVRVSRPGPCATGVSEQETKAGRVVPATNLRKENYASSN
jgi:hypothetical protein